MTPLQYHPEAEQEFMDSAARYDSKQAGLGDRFFDQVQIGLTRIQENPETGIISERGTRTFLVPGRFPYGIVFRQRHDHIQIIAVAHLHRRPGYWISRLEDES